MASVSVGAAAILFLRKEGDEMRANIEQADLLAREAHARARLYHEMAKHSRDMAEYAEQTVTAEGASHSARDPLTLSQRRF